MLFFLTVSSRAFSDEWVYTVKKGDTLWRLATDNLLNYSYVKKIKDWNGITDPSKLSPGAKIRIPTEWLGRVSIPIYINSMRGDVEVVKKRGKVSALKKGGFILAGDSISTKKASSVSLQFLDETRVILEENSTLDVELLEQVKNTGKTKTQLYLKKGRVETEVNPNKKTKTEFIIRTPVSVTSVRGTKYRISANPEKGLSHTEVVEGAVDVSNDLGGQLIPRDFGTIVLVDEAPKAPIKLLAPPNVSSVPTIFGQSPAQFSLPALEKLQSYQVQVTESENVQNIVFSQSFTSSAVQLSELPDATYQMRIRQVDQYGLEGKNARVQFTLKVNPKAPLLLEPKPSMVFFDKNPVFLWAADKDGQSYHFQLSKAIDFDVLIVDQKNVPTSHMGLDKALKAGRYFWRIAALDSTGQGPFSTPQVFYKKLTAPKVEFAKFLGDNLIIGSGHKLSEGQHYQLQIAGDEAFTVLFADKSFSSSDFKLPITKPGKYYTRIRIVEKNGSASPFTVLKKSIDIPESNMWIWLIPLLVLIILIIVIK